MFRTNKYRKWYCSIIDRAISENRKKGEIYYESHHVMPAAIAGTARRFGRKVLLTGKEHYLCHLLLIKFVDDEFVNSMRWALLSMSRHNKTRNGLTASQYETARKEFVKAQTGENNPFYGKRHSEENKKMIAKGGHKNRGKSPWNLGMPSPTKGIPRSPEVREKIRLARWGK